MQLQEALDRMHELMALPENSDFSSEKVSTEKTGFRQPGDPLPETLPADFFPARMAPKTIDFNSVAGLADGMALIERFDTRVGVMLLHPSSLIATDPYWQKTSTVCGNHHAFWGTEVFFTDQIEPNKAYLMGTAEEELIIIQPVVCV